MKDKIFEFIKKVQAVSHTGVTYSKCPYALDSYHELLDISSKMIHEYIQSDVQPYDIYKDVYYPTPQPCVRVIIIKDGKLLMVQENDTQEHLWSIPGGWCDIDNSPAQAAIKEAKEETGYDVELTKLVAVMDRNKYHKSKIYNVYNIVFLARIIGGENAPNYEVNKAKFFELDNIPLMSNKMSNKELEIAIEYSQKAEVFFEKDGDDE